MASYIGSNVPSPHHEQGRQTLLDIASLLEKRLERRVQIDPGQEKFLSIPKEADFKGLGRVEGQLVDGQVIHISFEILQVKEGLRGDILKFLLHFGKLSERIRLNFQEEKGFLLAGLQVQASPLSLSRSQVLLKEIDSIEDLALALQKELPKALSEKDLLERYDEFKEVLSPIFGLKVPSLPGWSERARDFILGNCSLALVSPYAVDLDYGLAVLSTALQGVGKTLGQLKLPSVPSRALIDLAKKAPGIVVVSASSLLMSSSPYEQNSEIKVLLEVLSSSGTPAIFTGSYPALQSIFHGGQGAVLNPLQPVVCSAPEVNIEEALLFCLRRSSQAFGSLSSSAEEEMVQKLGETLSGVPLPKAKEVLPSLVSHHLNRFNQNSLSNSKSFLSALEGATETLGGLGLASKNKRSSQIQQNFLRVFSDSQKLSSHFKQHLFGQDRALEEVSRRLMMQALTGPDHQPLRCCLQGTTGTGKSQFNILLAEILGIPYVNIDTSSIPDIHTGAAQLLGSATGIVGSYQAGRLERVAKHHQGAVVEISDLDHAPPHVMAHLADLFLQVLESGEAQSAKGAMFSCANLIFIFTMNLPEGADEEARKGIGFKELDRATIQDKVIGEIKKSFSSAFLSRVGNPILFEPLSEEALMLILKNALSQALWTGLGRMGFRVEELRVEKGVEGAIFKELAYSLTTLGARAFLEAARIEAALALERFASTEKQREIRLLKVALKKEELILKPC